MSDEQGNGNETAESEARSVTSAMKEIDWQDVMESEFVDFATGGNSIAFIFDHPEIGLHGFQYKKHSHHLKPVSFTRCDDD